MNKLLKLRDKRTDLDNVEIKFGEFWEKDRRSVSRWIRSALMRKARSLTLHTHHDEFLYLLGDRLVASPHLTTLDLVGVGIFRPFLDFAGCPALEDLRMHECHICVPDISSSSLKHLSITGCNVDQRNRLRVSAPGLVSLKLDGFSGITPFFKNMVLLEKACVNLGSRCRDVCSGYADSGIFCGADNTCSNCENYSNLVFLGRISSATHLELISELPNVRYCS